MKSPFRKAAVILAAILLGCVILILIKAAGSPPAANGRPGGKLSGAQEAAPDPEGPTSPSATDGRIPAGDASMGPTKVRERPIETALDKKRKEKRRLVEALEAVKKGGLAERHPTVVKITADLKKVEEELAAAGNGTPPEN